MSGYNSAESVTKEEKEEKTGTTNWQTEIGSIKRTLRTAPHDLDARHRSIEGHHKKVHLHSHLQTPCITMDHTILSPMKFEDMIQYIDNLHHDHENLQMKKIKWIFE